MSQWLSKPMKRALDHIANGGPDGRWLTPRGCFAKPATVQALRDRGLVERVPTDKPFTDVRWRATDTGRRVMQELYREQDKVRT